MLTAMRNLVFLIIFMCFWWCDARVDRAIDAQRTSERAYRQKKQFSLKVMSPVFLTVEGGKAVTMHCPVKPTIVRMYKYIRRVKHGKELEYARRKLAILLGLKYKWYKDGKAIKHHRTAWSMKLNKVHGQDSGLYTCKVVMAKGESSRSFTLRVYEQPKRGRPILETQQRNVSLKAGATTVLECISKNTKDRPQIRWLKWRVKNYNVGQELTNDIKTYMLLRNFKQFYELIDSKFYENFELRKNNGARVETAYGFRLRLKNVRPEDSGMYTCFVRNNLGYDHRNIFASVKPAVGIAPYTTNPKRMRPHFMAWPASSSPKLKCYVTGDQPLKYEWYKNGKKLTSRRLDPKINTSTWTLRLRELVPSDSGVYTCVVSNPYGSFKHNITVKVIERIRSAPILQPSYPKNVSTSKGENVSLECIELVSGPLPDYRWYKWHSVPAGYPKLDLKNASQYTIINPIHYSTIRVKKGDSYQYGGRLTLTNISQSDIALYTCVVRNHIGFDHSSAFVSLDVEGGPKFLLSKCRPSIINIPATESLNLDCSATGNPKPNISWLKNGKPLTITSQKNNGSMTISGYTLELIKLQPQHSANYSCNVSNSKGSISHTFNINIKEQLFSRPIILPPEQKAIKFGGKYELKCTVVSSEPLTVYWVRKVGKKGKEDVASDKNAIKLDKYIHSFSYMIPRATKDDNGVYWCVARNNVGSSSRKFEIQVEA